MASVLIVWAGEGAGEGMLTGILIGWGTRGSLAVLDITEDAGWVWLLLGNQMPGSEGGDCDHLHGRMLRIAKLTIVAPALDMTTVAPATGLLSMAAVTRGTKRGG